MDATAPPPLTATATDAMTEEISLAPGCLVDRLKDGTYVLLRLPTHQYLIKDPASIHLLQGLWARRPVEEVRDEVTALWSGQAWGAAVAALVDLGAITQAQGGATDLWTGYWQLAGAPPEQATAKLSACRVGLVVDEPLDEAALLGRLRAILRPFGAEAFPARADTSATATIAVSTGYARSLALLDGRNGYPVAFEGAVSVWGPACGPNGACAYCLMRGAARTRPYAARRVPTAGRSMDPASWIPAAETETVLSLAFTDIVRDLAGSARLGRHLAVFDSMEFGIKRHSVMIGAECPMHSASDRQIDWSAVLQDRSAVVRTSTGWRTRTPAVARDGWQRLVNPVTGPITRLDSGSPRQLPWMHFAVTEFPLHEWDAPVALTEITHRFVAAGKGSTSDDAVIGAIAEAAERFSVLLPGRLETIRGTYANLRAQGAVSPDACAGFSAAQLAAVGTRAARGPAFVPESFDPTTECDWVRMHSLAELRGRLVLASLLTECADPTTGSFATASSNGSAAGATLAEALLQAMLELIERDALAIWWYNQIERPPVRLDMHSDPYVRAIEGWHASVGRGLRVFDLTNDIAIPVFAAVSRADLHADEPRYLIGAGCHIDPEIAVMRAVTECNQKLPAALASPAARRAGVEIGLDGCSGWEFVERAWSVDAIALRALSLTGAVTFDWALQHVLDRCRAVGVDVLVADRTRAEFGIPVVQVVMPGIRHFWPRFGPGRLYDVPVRMGWLTEPSCEAALNVPFPSF